MATEPITLGTYASEWLKQHGPFLKPRTRTAYEALLQNQVLPEFRDTPLASIARGDVRRFVSSMLSTLGRPTVRRAFSVLRKLLNDALEDGHIVVNPASQIGKKFKLDVPANRLSSETEVRAMTKEQVARLLTYAERETVTAPVMFVMSRTGMRVGEALALQWQDCDFEKREIRISRTWSPGGKMGKPKSGFGRTVDMSDDLRSRLVEWRAERGMPPGTAWLFPSPVRKDPPEPVTVSSVQKAFQRVLNAADLPRHFTPHSLRHSFASILLQEGEPINYVQRALGHTNIESTVNIYGSWLPMRRHEAVNHLDRLLGGGTQPGAPNGASSAEAELAPAESREDTEAT